MAPLIVHFITYIHIIAIIDKPYAHITLYALVLSLLSCTCNNNDQCWLYYSLFLSFAGAGVSKSFGERIVVDFQLGNLYNTRTTKLL